MTWEVHNVEQGPLTLVDERKIRMFTNRAYFTRHRVRRIGAMRLSKHLSMSDPMSP